MKTLELVFDFASPNAWLVWKALPPVLERTGARLRVLPCLLGGIFKATGNQAPMMAFAHVSGKLAYESLEMRRFIARHGLSAFQMNPHFPVNSLLAMRCLTAAEMDGEDAKARCIEALLAGFWETGLKMDEPDVIAGRLNAAGLDAAAVLAKAGAADTKARLADATEAAVRRGAFGVPTFFIGDEMWFGKERLAQIEEALQS